MTTSREMILVCGTAKLLHHYGSWCGETHIQKTIFVAKSICSVPFDSEFVLYKYGPFSFDLNKSLTHMTARNLLALISNPGFGPSYEINEKLWAGLNNAVDGFFSIHEPKLRIICEFLAPKNVSELERIATAIYIENFEECGSRVDRENRMAEIKPHIQGELAELAFDEAAQLRAVCRDT